MNVFDKMLEARQDPDHGYTVGRWRRIKELEKDGDKRARDLLRNIHIIGVKPPAYWENPFKAGTDDYDSWENQSKDGADEVDKHLSSL